MAAGDPHDTAPLPRGLGREAPRPLGAGPKTHTPSKQLWITVPSAQTLTGSQGPCTDQFVMLHLCDFPINVSMPFPRPQGPGTLGAGLGVSTEWVLALWLTLREGRAGAREQKVHGGKGAGWGPGAAVFILSRPCLSQAMTLSLDTPVSFSSRELEGCLVVVDGVQRTRVSY